MITTITINHRISEKPEKNPLRSLRPLRLSIAVIKIGGKMSRNKYLLIVLGLCVILSGTAFAQLSGTKWIVSGVTATDTYPSMTAAINDLNTYGVGPGGVTFNVTAGQTFDEAEP
jgi:hypothetical protein